MTACGTIPLSDETVWGGGNADKKGRLASYLYSESATNMTDIVCSVFTPIQETREDGKEEDQEIIKNDDNNNSNTENMNKNATNAMANLDTRRKESRKPSHFDINTIMEEIDDLAQKRDSSPTPPSQPLPKTAREFIQRKKYEYLNFLLNLLLALYKCPFWPNSHITLN